MSTTYSRPVTAPRYLTCPSLTSRGAVCKSERATRGAPSQDPGEQHRRHPAGPRPARLRLTPMSARSHPSACTAGWPRSTASGCVASSPGSCTARTTSCACRRLNRKVRVLADWTEALFFQRASGRPRLQPQQPHTEFKQAAGLPPLPPGSSADAEASTPEETAVYRIGLVVHTGRAESAAPADAVWRWCAANDMTAVDPSMSEQATTA